MNNNDRNFAAEKIRSQYIEKEMGDLEELRALDRRVRRPANIFAYIFGSIGALVMGAGMSLVMSEIGSVLGISEPLAMGICIGIVGMIMAIVNYPIYCAILGKRRKKYASQILKLSEKVIIGK